MVVAYNDGRTANYHQLEQQDCKEFWTTWTNKLEEYWVKTLSRSPIDPCLVSHFDNLLALCEEKKKKLYHFNELRIDKPTDEPLKARSTNFSSQTTGDKKKYKSKEELIELLKKKKI